ncbi:MAG: hypothetical protein WC697_03755 [Patescibacteria group bacterium]|jgi:hypothetical protein
MAKNKVPEKKKSVQEEPAKKVVVLEGESRKSKRNFKKIGIIIWIISTIWIVCLINQDRKEATNVFLNGFNADKITMVNEIQPGYSISLTNLFSFPYPYKELQVKVISRRNGIWLSYSGFSKEKNEWLNAGERIRKIGIFQKIKTVKWDEERKWVRIELDTNFLWTTILGLFFILIFWIVVAFILSRIHRFTDYNNMYPDIGDCLHLEK